MPLSDDPVRRGFVRERETSMEMARRIGFLVVAAIGVALASNWMALAALLQQLGSRIGISGF